MDFPLKLTNEEFELRCKEWELAGYAVDRTGHGPSWMPRTMIGEIRNDWRRFEGSTRWKWFRRYEKIHGSWHLIETLLDTGEELHGVP